MDLSSKYICSGIMIIAAVLLICLLGVMNLVHPGEIYSLPILICLCDRHNRWRLSPNGNRIYVLWDLEILPKRSRFLMVLSGAVIAMSFIVLFAIISSMHSPS